MAFQATYRYGDAQPIPHVAGADIAAGDVFIVGQALVIAHEPILNGDEGSVYIDDGVYDVKSAGNYAKGIHVYWDDSGNQVTTSGGSNVYFGVTVEALTTGNVGRVLHVIAPPSTSGGSGL